MLAYSRYSNKGGKAVFEMGNNVLSCLSNGKERKTVDMDFDHSTSSSFSQKILFLLFLLHFCFQQNIAILGFQKHTYGHFRPTKKSSKDVSKSLKKNSHKCMNPNECGKAVTRFSSCLVISGLLEIAYLSTFVDTIYISRLVFLASLELSQLQFDFFK